MGIGRWECINLLGTCIDMSQRPTPNAPDGYYSNEQGLLRRIRSLQGTF